jgi:apolipoprotein D and lipocalin family protein
MKAAVALSKQTLRKGDLMRTTVVLLACLLAVSGYGCQNMPPIQTVDDVDLERFMGSWFVIASIPTFFEKDGYNGVETYRLDEDGHVETTFSFNKGGFDGPVKTYRPRGFIRDTQSNAVWGMQFVWPFTAEYRIIYLNDTYTQTVIGRTKRDYVWIMARDPSIPLDDYSRILQFLRVQGYDTDRIRKVPQKHNPGG